MESKYMNFVEIWRGGKTRTFEVRSRSHGSLLGHIKWHGPWRQYCFYPEPECVFNPDCMADISTAIKRLMEEMEEKV